MSVRMKVKVKMLSNSKQPEFNVQCSLVPLSKENKFVIRFISELNIFVFAKLTFEKVSVTPSGGIQILDKSME